MKLKFLSDPSSLCKVHALDKSQLSSIQVNPYKYIKMRIQCSFNLKKFQFAVES